jgi:hypothetical protein
MKVMATRTPKKGMKAFKATQTGKFFHVQSTLLSPFYPGHAEAFKLAADMVLDSHDAATTGPHNDKLLYPTIYLYRHCIEVKLKDVILLGVRMGNLTFNDKLNDIVTAHDLARLWTKAKQVLLLNYPKDKEQVSAVEAVVQEFHQIDKDGQTMRYDRDTSLKKRKYDHIPTHISIPNLRATMETVYSYLDGRYGGALDWWDASQEAARDAYDG